MPLENPVLVEGPGRQPVIDYVTKDYNGFRQAMLDQIPLLMPAWTNRSENDFGVVLIELFAYVADILSYYQDRIANEAFLSTATQRRSVTELLRLIGYQIDPGLAASAWIHFDAVSDVTVGRNILPYQIKSAGLPGQADVTFEIAQQFTVRVLNNGIGFSGTTSLPVGLSAVSLPGTSHSLVVGDRIYLEEKLPDDSGSIRTRRSSLLQIVSITTVSGGDDILSWLPPLSETYNSQKTVLKGNNVLATHGKTISDEPATIGDGTPSQEMKLSRGPVTYLLRADALQRRRSSPEVEILVDDIRWEEVDSLAFSGPTDLHYFTTVDENDLLTLHFGTGARGAVPPAGSQIQATYRVGLGSRGNVGPDTLTVSLTSISSIKAVTNPFAAAGGLDGESTDEARISGPGSLIAQDRAVTLRDYEMLATTFPGVGKAKARVGLRGGYKVVQVFIAPQNPDVSPPPMVSAELRDALKGVLEARQPVNRMAGVDVLNPVYVPVDIGVEVHAKSQSAAARIADDIKTALSDFLSFAKRDFGQPVRVGEVFAILYPVPGVAYALLKSLSRGDAVNDDFHAANAFADVPILDNELAYAGALSVQVVGGI